MRSWTIVGQDVQLCARKLPIAKVILWEVVVVAYTAASHLRVWSWIRGATSYSGTSSARWLL